jgi:hypothetical protein
MSIFPVFQLPLESTKLRFKEPFGTEGLNLKMAGIIPTGIYRGFIPNPAAGKQLFINTDGSTNDSVAVIETPPALSTARFNLTVRSTQQIVLDFTGHDFSASGPLFVVIRAQYAISPSPLTGLTDAKVLAVKTALNNADPQSLHDGDIKICKVLGIVADMPNISTVIPSDRQDNGGPLATQVGSIKVLASVKLTSGDFSVPLTSPPFTFFPIVDPSLPLTFTLLSSQRVIILCSAYGEAGVDLGEVYLTPVIDSVLEDPTTVGSPFGTGSSTGTGAMRQHGNVFNITGSIGFVVEKVLGAGAHSVGLAAAAGAFNFAKVKMSQPPLNLIVLGGIQ